MLAAIASRTEARAAALASEFKVQQLFSTVTQMLAEGRLDLLVVSVRETDTVRVLTECLATGLPILTEKPVGLDLSHCQAVFDIASRGSARLWVGLNRRCYSVTRQVLDGLDNSGPRLIEVRDAQDLDVARSYGWPEPIINNWMFCNSIHLVDYLSVFGRGDVIGIDVIERWTPADPGLVLSHIRFSSGDIGIYRCVWNRPGGWACDVTTREQRWEMRPLEQARAQKRGERSFRELDVAQQDLSFKAGFRFQAQDVVDAVRGGAAPKVVPDIAAALKTTKLIADIYSLTVR
jgi:predicted dehydrogenase